MSSSSSARAEAKRKSCFDLRQLTLMKKAQELSTLCAVEVAVICYGPDGEIQTWPRHLSNVRDVAQRYMYLIMTDKRKKSLTVHEFLNKIKIEDDKKKKEKKEKKKKGFGTDKLDGFTAEELSDLLDFLDRKSQTFQERLRFLHTQKQMNLSPSETQNDQCRDFSTNLEIFRPEIFSSSAESDLSIVPWEQQVTESVHLQGEPMFSECTLDESYEWFNNGGFSSVPCSYINYTPFSNQAQTPLLNQNFSSNNTNGDWLYNSVFPGMQTSYQIRRTEQEEYESVNGFQQVSGFNNVMMMNNDNMNNINNMICLQSQFPHIQTATPLQQFNPFSAWNPTQPTVSSIFSRF